MPHRLLRLLTILLAFVLIAAACGDDDDTGGEDDTTTTAADDGGDDGEATTTTAAADDGEADGDTEGDDGGEGDDTTEGDDGGEGDDGSAGGGDVYDDPRGGVFAEFQTGFDRSHPFQSLDAFCVEHDAAAELTETDAGITAESVVLVHLRSRLEQFIDIGFGIPIGDATDAFDAFAAAINDCGGIRGRQVDLRLVEVDVTGAEDIDALRNAACIEATEDNPGVIVMNSTGFQGSANLCLVEEAEVAFISTQGQSDEFMERGAGRLISLSPTLGESLRFLANDLIEAGALDGATIGVVAPDTPGQAEAVEDNLVALLEDAGYEVTFDIIGCAGGTTCTEGIPDSVANMLDSGVDVMFPTLNVVSWPQYLTEMVTQGVQPGDIAFYNSDFNSQAGELVASKIIAFGGEAAGELYNGTTIVDDADTGGYRANDFATTPFEDMCQATYAQYSPAGLSYEPERQAEDGAYGMVVTICAEMRMAARAIYDAGENPTRDEIYEALSNLGPIDFAEMLPASVTPDKPQAPDVIHTLEFSFPCDQPFPYGEEQICISPVDDYRPAPR